MCVGLICIGDFVFEKDYNLQNDILAVRVLHVLTDKPPHTGEGDFESANDTERHLKLLTVRVQLDKHPFPPCLIFHQLSQTFIVLDLVNDIDDHFDDFIL